MEKKASLYPFIQKLYGMLNDPNNSAYIAWSDPGDQFTVYNPAEFSSQLLPQQFKHNNFCSFIRQLNIYGFHKVESDNWVFTHEDGNFQRGRLDLLSKITRRKQQKRSAPSEAEGEKPAKVAKMSAESTPGTPLSYPMTPTSSITALSPLPTTPQPFQVPSLPNFSPSITPPAVAMPSNAISPLNLLPNGMYSPPQNTAATEVLLKMNETVVNELQSVKRKGQTQDNTIAWLIQELLKSKKEIEELKRTVKALQFNATEELQRKQVLDMVQGQQQHQRQLHMQLQQQLQTQPGLLTPSFQPIIKSEVSAVEQLAAQPKLQPPSQPSQLRQSFDLNYYLSMNNIPAETPSPDSASSDDGLAVLEGVYDGPDWMQMSQIQ